jgi:hypothetical protein
MDYPPSPLKATAAEFENIELVREGGDYLKT